MKDFKIRISPFEKVLKQALAQTYAYQTEFANESDFKHELFHQLHGMEINGYKLGDKFPGYKTSMLHSEAKPVNGLRGKGAYADLLICNPKQPIQRGYNYKTEIVIELKKSLDAKKLADEIEKFAKYNGAVRKLYIASANVPKIDRASAKRIILEQKPPGTSIEVHDRSSISYTPASQSRQRSKAKTPLAERVARCITTTLKLYGNNRSDPDHNFFWRNYEHEDSKGWTFPSEKDFVCQLYHRLRTHLKNTVVIQTEYHPPLASNREVDLFVDGTVETVGIEVKMNYDNCRGEEPFKLSQRFNAMTNDNHTNFLVVIQGEDAHRGNYKATALRRLQKSVASLGVLHYDEIRNKAIGPVSVEEAQKLAIR